MYSQNDYRYYTDELYHHGIVNQKWGVRHGPPYPLSQEKHEAVVGIDPRMSQKNMDDANSYPKFNLKDQAKYFRSHPIENIDEMDKLSKNADLKKTRFAINHGGEKPSERFDKNGRFYNCPNCATAFEMVERGYDVVARPKANGSNVENIESFYKGGKLKQFGIEDFDKAHYDLFDRTWRNPFNSNHKWDKFDRSYEEYATKAAQNVFKAVDEAGDGARGVIVVGWRMDYDPSIRTTAFHAFNWKTENGKAKFYDSQSKWDYNGMDDNEIYDSLINDVDPREIYLMRTDNLEMSDTVGEAVISRRKV